MIDSYPNCSSATGDCHEKPLHLAIGMFDGVHVGHQAVISQAIAAANEGDGHCSGVLTFDPHPSRILHPSTATRLLMSLERRIKRIHSVGADIVLVQQFTREYASQPATDFVPSLRKLFPNLNSIHVGQNFRFGSGRSGDVDTLRKSSLENGVELHSLQRRVLDGSAISSSRIRLALAEGSISEVNAMLGRPYSINGCIQKGKGVGRELNFPTLNIPWNPEVSPRYGVYLITLRNDDGNDIHGIANFGLRPTIGGATDPILEVHLIEDTALPETGDFVDIRLHKFIRPEKEFDTLNALKSQIEKDVGLARDALRNEAFGP